VPGRMVQGHARLLRESPVEELILILVLKNK
jgi:hypothetical protein